MRDEEDHGPLGRPEDVRRAGLAWVVLLGTAAVLFVGAAVLTG